VCLISITELALQVMHNGSTIGMQILARLQKDRFGSVMENNNIIASSILLKAFGVHF